MNKNFIPTPQDEAMRLEASITKTANFAGTAFDQGIGFAPGGVGMPAVAVVNVTAADRASTDETYSFVLQESNDNASWNDCGAAQTVDVAGSAATLGAISVAGMISKRYVRVGLTVGGTTPSITYEAWLNTNACPT